MYRLIKHFYYRNRDWLVAGAVFALAAIVAMPLMSLIFLGKLNIRASSIGFAFLPMAFFWGALCGRFLISRFATSRYGWMVAIFAGVAVPLLTVGSQFFVSTLLGDKDITSPVSSFFGGIVLGVLGSGGIILLCGVVAALGLMAFSRRIATVGRAHVPSFFEDVKEARSAFSKPFSWLVALAVLSLVYMVVGGDGTNKKQFHNIVKKDGNVYFKLGDRDFVIPEGNFKGGSETGGGLLIRATLHGLLPDFEGYDKNKNHDEFIKHTQGRGWGRYAQMELYRRSERINVPKMVSRGEPLESNDAFSGRLGNYDELRYGLEYYRSPDYGPDIYLYVENGTPEIYIRCPSELMSKSMSSPSCTYHWDISDGTSYEMWYSIDYLPLWREIWGNARRLLGASE